jgi:hypothetical protein
VCVSGTHPSRGFGRPRARELTETQPRSNNNALCALQQRAITVCVRVVGSPLQCEGSKHKSGRLLSRCGFLHDRALGRIETICLIDNQTSSAFDRSELALKCFSSCGRERGAGAATESLDQARRDYGTHTTPHFALETQQFDTQQFPVVAIVRSTLPTVMGVRSPPAAAAVCRCLPRSLD